MNRGSTKPPLPDWRGPATLNGRTMHARNGVTFVEFISAISAASLPTAYSSRTVTFGCMTLKSRSEQ